MFEKLILRQFRNKIKRMADPECQTLNQVILEINPLDETAKFDANFILKNGAICKKKGQGEYSQQFFEAISGMMTKEHNFAIIHLIILDIRENEIGAKIYGMIDGQKRVVEQITKI